jgi:hypothetical protein
MSMDLSKMGSCEALLWSGVVSLTSSTDLITTFECQQQEKRAMAQ